jgi:hypothetical protein
MTRIVPLLALIASIFGAQVATAQYGPPPRIFVIHGISRTCDSIPGIDRALSIEDAHYFAGWTTGDYDTAAVWSGACVADGYRPIGSARAARLREYQHKVEATQQKADAERQSLERQRTELAQERADLVEAQAKLLSDQQKLRAKAIKKIKIAPAVLPGPAVEPQLIEGGSYTNVDGDQVHSPAHTDDGSVPSGATAQCRDETYSFSRHHRGTCSHHGGVFDVARLEIHLELEANSKLKPGP